MQSVSKLVLEERTSPQSLRMPGAAGAYGTHYLHNTEKQRQEEYLTKTLNSVIELGHLFCCLGPFEVALSHAISEVIEV